MLHSLVFVFVISVHYPVGKSFWRQTVLSANCPISVLSRCRTVLSAYCLVAELSCWRTVLSANCLVGLLSVSQLSVGKLSVGEVSVYRQLIRSISPNYVKTFQSTYTVIFFSHIKGAFSSSFINIFILDSHHILHRHLISIVLSSFLIFTSKVSSPYMAVGSQIFHESHSSHPRKGSCC